MSLPILLRLADRCIRWWRQNRAGSHITAAEFVGEDVVALEISRPPNFTFRSAFVSPKLVHAFHQQTWLSSLGRGATCGKVKCCSASEGGGPSISAGDDPHRSDTAAGLEGALVLLQELCITAVGRHRSCQGGHSSQATQKPAAAFEICKWAPLDVAFVVPYRPGMYLYLHLPEVARREWHPFSLAGAPSAQSLAVFVRQSGKPAGTACAFQFAVLGGGAVRSMGPSFTTGRRS